jgi:hypothetical protein
VSDPSAGRDDGFRPGHAQLSGRIPDESGAVLPGVTIFATQTDATARRSRSRRPAPTAI